MGNGCDSETGKERLLMSYTAIDENILDDVGTLYYGDEITSCEESEESVLDDIFGDGNHFVIRSIQTQIV